MNSDRRTILPRRELIRALLLALWNKIVEFFVLAKVRWQNGVPDDFDRRALSAIHAMMLRQIGRMRRVCDASGWGPNSIPSSDGVHNAQVILSASNPAWQAEAVQEAASLRGAMGSGSVVHHIGSTAIQRLKAKPIVDLAATLPAERFGEAFEPMKTRLHALGYRYLGVRGGHFFEKATQSVRTHALQVHPAGGQILTELLRFRDALRVDEALRADYEVTKMTLAAYFPGRRLFYVFYKSHWIDDWQWRHSDVTDWANWFVGQKRAQAELAKASRGGR